MLDLDSPATVVGGGHMVGPPVCHVRGSTKFAGLGSRSKQSGLQSHRSSTGTFALRHTQRSEIQFISRDNLLMSQIYKIHNSLRDIELRSSCCRITIFAVFAGKLAGGVVYFSKMSPITQMDELRPQTERDETRLRQAGFRWGEKGTHTSRTIMLNELRSVLAHCRPGATRDDYLSAIHEDNCLGKRTAATRKLSSQRLSELYALDPEVPLFRVMRRCWYADGDGQSLLALLLALARDPLLWASAPPILRMRPGEELARQQMTDALDRAVGRRLSESTLDKVVRNTASSWTQSGHLKGRGRKVRQRVVPTPVTTSYAMLLGHLAGGRGEALFGSLWAQVLDAPAGELMHLATDARRLGFLDMSQSGGVIDVSFSRLLAQDERR